jgi:hypothetical protein
VALSPSPTDLLETEIIYPNLFRKSTPKKKTSRGNPRKVCGERKGDYHVK